MFETKSNTIQSCLICIKLYLLDTWLTQVDIN